MNENGFDFSEFNQLIKNLEQLSADMDAVAEAVLNAGEGPAKEAYTDNVPYDTSSKNEKQHGHARDNVIVSKTKTGKKGSKYRLISFKGDRSYLYMIDYGTSKMAPKPWREKANRATRAAALPAMENELRNQLEKHLGG